MFPPVEPVTGRRIRSSWTQRVLGGIAPEVRAVALFPFGGPPYLPSALGHARRRRAVAARHPHSPDYGLWTPIRRARLCRAAGAAAAHRAARPANLRRSGPASRLPVGAFTDGAMTCRPASALSGPAGGPAGARLPCPPRLPGRPTPWLWRGPGAFHMAPSWPLTPMVNPMVTIGLPFFPYHED